MFSRANAINPPPTKIIRTRRTIGRRVKPNVSSPLITGDPRGSPVSVRGNRQGVAQKQSAFGGYQFSRMQTFEDLIEAVAQEAGFHRPHGESTTVGGHPHRHGAVALSHHAV